MNLGKNFEIKKKFGKNHSISLSELETIYKDENEEVEPQRRLETNKAKMKETYVNEKGDTVSEDYYVYFEIPYGEKSGGLALIPKLIESYEQSRNHTPIKYQYNYIGSIYYDKAQDALIYAKVCTNKDVKKLIENLNKKLRRFRVKGRPNSGKQTILEKMAEKFNTTEEEINMKRKDEPESLEEDDKEL